MRRIGIIGAKGFLGIRLGRTLSARGYAYSAFREDAADVTQLERFANGIDAVFHLAGTNRAADESTFDFNRASTEALISAMRGASAKDGRTRQIVFASSTKTETAVGTPYARSKLAAEQLLESVASPTLKTTVLRFPNLFGPGGKPFYNSAIATFIWLTAKGRQDEVRVDGDGSQIIDAVSVDRAAERCLEALGQGGPFMRDRLSGRLISVGERANTTRDTSRRASWPELEETFRWYATRPPLRGQREVKAYPRHAGRSGSFQELAHGDNVAFGQLSHSTVGVSYARGGHYHEKKEEWFFVLDGRMAVDFSDPQTGAYIDTQTLFVDAGSPATGLHIPAPYLHAVRNLGTADISYIIIANEPFDPQRPDTYRWGRGPLADTPSGLPT